MRTICSLAVAALFTFDRPLSAAPKDVAELFPGTSIGFIEIRQPGLVAKQLAAFFKDSAFENALPLIDKMRESRRGDYIDTAEAGLLATFFGPEMLKEAERFEGIAAALTGFDKKGDPEFAAVVLPGESRVPGLMMRAFLSAHPSLRKIDKVEGVELYQENQQFFFDDPLAPGGTDVGRPIQYRGPVFAYDGGIIVIGSSKSTVGDSIRRFKGKEKSESLAANPEFKSVAAEREPAGLFLYADAKAVFTRLTAVSKDRKTPESTTNVLIRQLLPAASVKVATARINLSEQKVELLCSIKLDSRTANPIAELLSGSGVAVRDLPFSGKDAPLCLTLNLPSGEQRLPRLLGVLDSIVKATGTLGPSASEMLQELADKKIVSQGMVGQIDRISVALPPVTAWPKEGLPTPALFLHSVSAEALDALEAAIPAILELLGGEKADAVTETIDGVKLRSLEAKASPMGQPIHYARGKQTLAIGTDRKFLVAGVLGNKADAEFAEAMKPATPSALVGWWNWPEMYRPPVIAKGKVETPPPPPQFRGIDSPYAIASSPGPLLPPTSLLGNLKGLPPLVMTLGADKNEIRVAIRQTDPNKLRAKAIDAWFEWFVRSSSGGIYRSYPTIPDFDGPLLIPAPAP